MTNLCLIKITIYWFNRSEWQTKISQRQRSLTASKLQTDHPLIWITLEMLRICLFLVISINCYCLALELTCVHVRSEYKFLVTLMAYLWPWYEPINPLVKVLIWGFIALKGCLICLWCILKICWHHAAFLNKGKRHLWENKQSSPVLQWKLWHHTFDLPSGPSYTICVVYMNAHACDFGAPVTLVPAFTHTHTHMH